MIPLDHLWYTKHYYCFLFSLIASLIWPYCWYEWRHCFTWALWEHKLFLHELQPAERMPWSRRASPPAGAGTSDRWKREALPPKKKKNEFKGKYKDHELYLCSAGFRLMDLNTNFSSVVSYLSVLKSRKVIKHSRKNTLQINGPFGFRKLHTSIVSWFFLISRLVCSNRTSSVLVCSNRRSVFFDWLHNADDGPLENRNNENPIFRWRKKGNN